MSFSQIVLGHSNCIKSGYRQKDHSLSETSLQSFLTFGYSLFVGQETKGCSFDVCVGRKKWSKQSHSHEVQKGFKEHTGERCFHLYYSPQLSSLSPVNSGSKLWKEIYQHVQTSAGYRLIWHVRWL